MPINLSVFINPTGMLLVGGVDTRMSDFTDGVWH